MNLYVFLILIMIGLAAGVFGGFVGLGGGVIMIPAMIYLLGMSQFEAQGTSLAVMLPPVGILAAMNYYKAGQLNWKYALIIAITFTLGGFIGSKLALNIPVTTVKKIFGFVLLGIGLNIILGK
ncbi:MAG: sulfite exporter TauE/SafE family protein [Bacteroidota bacterium]